MHRRITPSQRVTLGYLRDHGPLGHSALSLQQLADLYALRDQELVTFTGGGQFGVWRLSGDAWSVAEGRGGAR